ncbi:hypothetical protein ABL78_1422 [Leptomonas seymouri]|uniref:Uncharacterized protein n=1 Tax=Leptomonas seymouri TaxID=5684 RepID=A0A0N1IAN7_LEPSE|nr:hypothetical protein ABL78_1422 [Leptomonas seymouri]|eukprot:KPI89458.1 hypothetical protein ABL78_1422 [Leptomonas seymouri]
MSSLSPSSCSDFKGIIPSKPPNRAATLQNPEDAIASRYLQRLGNTFVRRGLPDLLEKSALGSRTASFKSRRQSLRPTSGVPSSLAAGAPPSFAALALSSYTRGEDGVSATRRWRSQMPGAKDNMVSVPEASSQYLSSFDLEGSPPKVTNGAGAREWSPRSPTSETSRGAEGIHVSVQHARPTSKQQRRRLEASQSFRLSASASATNLPYKSSSRRISILLDGAVTQDAAHATGTSKLTSKREERSRMPGRGFSSAVQQRALPLKDTHRMASAYYEATVRANTAVSQAAALMSSGAPPPRKVRTDEERSAMVLAQERSKLMLLVGRRANLETDIEEVLELAEDYDNEYLLQAHKPATSDTGAQSVTGNNASFFKARSQRKRCGSMSSMADADAQLSIEPGAVRRCMRRLLTNLLGNGVLGSAGGGGTLDTANLIRVVQQLQSQLDLVEDDLVDRFEGDGDAFDDLEASTPTMFEVACRMRATSAMPNTGEAMQTTQPGLKLLQLRKQVHQKKQAELREGPSNQERMEWLIDSVDAEMLTDLLAESYMMEQAGPPSSRPPLPSALRHRDRALAERKVVVPAVRKKPALTAEGVTTALSLSPHRGHTDSVADGGSSTSFTETVSQPSMVPFSLSDSMLEEGEKRACSATSKGPRRISSCSRRSAAYGLNLLGFMEEVLSQYEFDPDSEEGRLRRKRRPLTAPLKSSLFFPQSLLRSDGLTDGHGGDDLDSGNDDGDMYRGEYNKSGNASPMPESFDEMHKNSSLSNRGPDGKRQLLFANSGDYAHKSRSPDDRFSPSDSSGAYATPTSKGAMLLGAQLRNLRSGLLRDLYNLRTLYDYVHFIDDRRRELKDVAGVTENDYEAELERKLEERRLQNEAAQRARDDAQRLKEENEKIGAFGLGGGGQGRRGQDRPSQPSMQSYNSAARPPAVPEAGSAADINKNAAAIPPLSKEKSSSPEIEKAGPAVEDTAKSTATEVETELTREFVMDGKLYFMLVGFSAGSSGSSTGKVREDVQESTKRPVGSAGSASGTSENYLRYELRVKKLDVAQSSSKSANESADAVPSVAMVKVNPRRLLNLKLTPAAGVSVSTQNSGTVVSAAIEAGAPPTVMFSLVPVKRYKASSFAKAFEFGTNTDAAHGGKESRANSVASMPFTFPSPGENSRSASLDSATVVLGATAAQIESDVSPLGFNARSSTVGFWEGVKGEDRTQPGSAARIRKTSSRGSVVGKVTKSPSKPADDGTTPPRRKKSKVKLSASANAPTLPKEKEIPMSRTFPPIRSKKASVSVGPPPSNTSGRSRSSAVHSASVTRRCSSVRLPLPSTPPMLDTQRPIAEWGVALPHAEMEALEKNAVVLTLLSPEEEGYPGKPALPAELQEGILPPASVRSAPSSAAMRGSAESSALSPAEALLAMIPDVHDAREVSGAGAEKGERQLSASAAAAAVIDAVASELLRQVMEGAGVEEGAVSSLAAEDGVNAAATLPIGQKTSEMLISITDQGEEGIYRNEQNNSPQLPVTQDKHEAPLDRAGGAHDKDGISSDLRESAQFSQFSSSLTSQRQPQQVPSLTSTTPQRPEPRKPGALSSKSKAPPKRIIGMKAPPSLTISSSQSRPMRADEVQQYGGGLFRLDIVPEDVDVVQVEACASAIPAAGGALSTAQKRIPGPTSAEAVLPGRQTRPLTAAGPFGKPLEASLQDGISTPTTTDQSIPTLPPVLTKQTAGSTKVHLLVPQEVVTSSLGPRMQSAANPELRPAHLQSTEHEVRTSMSATATTVASKGIADENFIAESFSVLPKSGVAAEAATDVRTIMHVQNFLQAVMRSPTSEVTGATGSKNAVGFSGVTQQGDAPRVKVPSIGGAGSMLSEVDQLHDAARQLFILDPVRYDAVVTELMQQIADDMRRDFPRAQQQQDIGDAPSRVSMRSSSSAALSLPRLLDAIHPRDQAGDGWHPTSRQGSTNMVQKGNAEEAETGQGSCHMSQANLSSALSHPHRRSITATARGSGTISVDLDAVGAPYSPQGKSSLLAHTEQGGLAAFSPSLNCAKRRSTHTLVMQSGAAGSNLTATVAAQRKSCSDAVAEVERILYEQMKAKLLLRAILEKMRTLWEAKQRSVEEKNRSRVAQHMQKMVNRALAASWPIERQRVVNLRKLVYILDRWVGRVHGWLPHYSDANVLMESHSTTKSSSLLCTGRTKGSSTRMFMPFATWSRGKDEVDLLGGDGSSADGAGAEACPRYMRYLPQRRIYHYMRLAKSRRLLPLQLVRADIQECHSRHILLGYEKIPLEEDEASSSAGPVHAGWPKRRLPINIRLAKQRRGEFIPDSYDDMKTRGERERYRRRLQGTASFQGVSKMFSPRPRQDADLGYSLY